LVSIPDGGTRLSSNRWILLQLAQDAVNIHLQDIMALMKRLALLGLMVCGCGGTQRGSADTPDPHLMPQIADDAKLTKEQCIELVDHAFEVYVRAKPPADDLAKAEQERDNQKSDDSLNQCMQDVNGKFYKCVLMAQTREAIDACGP
jgi:hypothetical protein